MSSYNGFELFEGGAIATTGDGTFTIRGNTEVENATFKNWIDDFLNSSVGGLLFPRDAALGLLSVRAIPTNKEFPDYQGLAINDAAYKEGGAMGLVSKLDAGGSQYTAYGKLFEESPEIISINLELKSLYLLTSGNKTSPSDNEIVFLHELFHGINRSFVNQGGVYNFAPDGYKDLSAYEEHIVIFYTNFLVQSLGLDFGERVGHSSSGWGASKSSVSYLQGSTATSYRFVNGDFEAGFRTPDGGSIIKTYVMGNNPILAGSAEATSGADVVEVRYAASSLSEYKINDILKESAVQNSDPLQFLKSQIVEQNERSGRDWILNPEQMLVASGERIVGIDVDVEGPRPDSRDGNFVTLEAGDTSARTIIFGAAGWSGIEGNSAKATKDFQAIDRLVGGDGNDWIVSFSDRDGNELDGGKGDDFIVGSDKNDIIRGGEGAFDSGADALIGRGGDDELFGGGGDDELIGGEGQDKLYGGLGDDTLFADTDDLELDGGLGHDKVDYRDSKVAVDWVAATTKIEGIEEIIGSDFDDIFEMPTSLTGQLLDSDLIIDGGKGDDKIRGTELANDLRGGDGDDVILGLGGADIIDGGDGDDLLVGGEDDYLVWPDDDEIHGGAGDDRISGGAGDDKIWGGADDDGLLGGKGDDVLHGDEGKDLLAGGDGDDYLYGDQGDDGLVGDGGSDHLFGGVGNDTLVGGEGVDFLNGEGGNDIIDAAQSDSEADFLKGEGGNDIFIVNTGDKILDLEKGDRIIMAGQFLNGGEKTTPPANPCDRNQQQDPDSDDGTYKGANGATYQLTGGTLSISLGGENIVLEHFRNGDGGIRLKPTRTKQDQAECKRDPLIIDLNGDRDVYDKLADSGAYFDLDNDGFAEHVAWAQRGDGFLVLDRNGNGLIDDGHELFGSNYAQQTGGAVHRVGESGFAELGQLDSNHDFLITAADVDFAKLQVWMDANGDGVTQEGELKSLAELGIVSISLTARDSDAEVCGCDGTTVPLMSDILRADGSSMLIYDAFLAIDQYDTREIAAVEVPGSFRDLPFLIGSGSLSDLDVAMARDGKLEQLVREFAGLEAGQAGEITDRVVEIILRWTGADTVRADSRGSYINAQVLAALEKMSGSAFNQGGVGPNPRGDAASILIDDWDAIVKRTTAELLGQTTLGAQLTPGLSFAGAAFFSVEEGTNFSLLIQNLPSNEPAGSSADKVKYWHAIIGTLSQYAGNLGVTLPDLYAAIEALPAVQVLGLTARELSDLSVTSAITRTNIGTGFTGSLASGKDVLFADETEVTLNGRDGNDVYVLTSTADKAKIKDSNGYDRLILVDQARADITINVTAGPDGWGNDKVIVALSNAATGWSLSLEGRIDNDLLFLEIDEVDFTDQKGVRVVDLLPSEIYSPSGQRIFYGANEQISLLGSVGDDVIVGRGRADRYMLTQTSGHDKIDDRGSGQNAISTDRLVIDALLEDVTFEIAGAAGQSLIVRNAQGQSVTIIDQWSSDHGIELFEFVDGSSLTALEVNALLMTGTAQMDQISGTPGNDLIDGLGGSDVVAGNYGNDTYVFNRGYGQLTVDDALGHNRIRFGGDILSTEITIERAADGVRLSLAGTSDSVFVRGGRSYQDLVLEFASGEVSLTDWLLSQSSPNQLPVDGIIRGTSKTDFDVSGTDDNDIIDGLGGDEWLSGYFGDDVYMYSSGRKYIDESDGFDIIRLAPNLTFDTLVFQNGLITFEGRRDYIEIDNYWDSAGNLYPNGSEAYVEGLVFADGRIINLVSDKILTGGDGDDFLFSFGSVNETFTPGEGNDRIFAGGSGGTKTVVLGHNFGHDTLYPGTNFRLDLSAFTLDASIGMRREGNDLIVSTNGGANDVRVKRVFDPRESSGYAQSSLLFSGGVTLTMANVIQRITVATAGNDILFGRTSLDGGAGDDILIGTKAANDYRFGKGYGNDIIKEQGDGGSEYSVQDTLTLVGLKKSDVTFTRDPVDLETIVITIKETGETVRIDGTPFDDRLWFDPRDNFDITDDSFGAHYIERIVFADGEVISQRQIEQQLLDAEATAGDDVITTFGMRWGATEPSYVDGGAGNDTYITSHATVAVRFSAGSGHDRVIMNSMFKRDLKIKLSGINPADVLVTVELRDGEAHMIFRAKDGSELAVPGAVDSGRKVFVTAENGTVYEVHQAGPLIYNRTTTSGDDWMGGFTSGAWANFSRPAAYDDYFEGGAGNDVIQGFAGNDTVIFGRGDGQDVLLDSLNMGTNRNIPQTYKIQFKAGVVWEDIKVKWDPAGTGNVKISIIGTDDSILVSPQNLASLTFADGRTVRTTNANDGSIFLDLNSLAPAPTDGDDILFVKEGQTIDGGAGNDTIYLLQRNDFSEYIADRTKIVFGRGSGHDIYSNPTGVALYDGYYRQNDTRNTVQLKGILSLDEISLIKSGADLIIKIKDTGETLTVKDQMLHDLSNDWVETPVVSFDLESGQRYYFPWLQDMIVGGDYEGDDSLASTASGGILDGGAGNDVLRGSTGDDRYVLGRGYDEDRIIDAGGTNDRIFFQEGVSSNDVVFSRTGANGADLLIEVLGDDRLTLTVSGQFAGESSRVESFVFSDGTVFGWNDVQRLILESSGTSDGDTIVGFATADVMAGNDGADQFTGLGGNDVIDGGAGRDTAVFRGSSSEYRVTTVDGVTTVEDLVSGRDGVDQLANVEDLRFLGDGSTVLLTPANYAPVAHSGNASIAEDGELIIGRAELLALVTDADGDPLSLSVGGASHGQAWLDRDGNVHFRPSADYSGEASFDYTVNDGNGGTSTGRFAVSVAESNDAPRVGVATLGEIFVNEDSPIAFALPANLFSDPDGDPIAFSIKLANGGPAPAWLKVENGILTGMPPANYNGQLNLTVVASDGQLDASIPVLLTVQARNDAPAYTAGIDSQEVRPGTPFTIDLGSHPFQDVDGDTVSVSLTLADGSPLPEWMTFANGVLTGTPPSEFAGLDLMLAGSDGRATTRAYLSLATPDNQAPQVVNEISDQTVDEDHPIDLLLPETIFNDADGDALTETMTLGDGSALPSWLNYANGRLTGTPPVNYHGDLELRLTASDGILSASDTFTLSIRSINDVPVVAIALVDRTVPASTAIDFAVPAGTFADADGDDLTLTATLADGNPLPSWLTFFGGRFAGQPPAGFGGDLQIIVSASDGQAAVSDQFRLTVQRANQAPTANPDVQFFTVQGHDLSILPGDVLANDVDPDGDTLRIVSLGTASHGSVGFDADGMIRFSPDGSFSGADQFTYTVTDGEFSSTSIISVRVESTFANWGQGTAGDDRLFGNQSTANRLDGLAGDDHIKGGMFDDRLAGGDGNDQIQGLAGNDHLWGGAGNDMLLGNGGFDTAYLMGSRSAYSIVTANGLVSVVDNAPTVDGDDGQDMISSIELLSFKNGETASVISPIILDLDGQGVQTVSASSSKALFDLDGDGLADDTSWIGKTEAFLFLDRDGNGTVSGANEISFIDDVAGARSDLEGLRAFDTNHDGKLSSADERFGAFKLWQDRDSDGAVDEGEIISLATAGVASINLNGAAVTGSTRFGDVAVVNQGTYTRTNGTAMQFLDAALSYFSAATNPASIDPVEFSFDHRAGKYRLVAKDGVLHIGPKSSNGQIDDRAGALGASSLLSFRGRTIGLLAPVVLDLDGDGIKLVKSSKAAAQFDMNGDGIADNTGWIEKGDGFLVIDRNNNGVIDGANELSLATEDGEVATGLTGLAKLDSNGDSTVDAADARFGELRIWQDGNGDGICQSGELKTLNDAGIKSISLRSVGVEGSAKIGESLLVATTTFKRENGSVGTVGDAFLGYEVGHQASPALNVIEALRRYRHDDHAAVGEWDALVRDLGLSSGRSAAAAIQDDLPASISNPQHRQIAEKLPADTAPDGIADRRFAVMIQDIASFGSREGTGLDQQRWHEVRPVDFFA